MPRNDSPHVGQPDARALEFILAMQPLKNSEQPVRVSHVKTHPVVAHKNDRFPGVSSR